MNAKIYTLLFLRKDGQLLLAMKKRGFGAGRYNGVGGKIETDETIEAAMKREAGEEIGIVPVSYRRVGVNDFIYETDEEAPKRMYTHIYFCDEWEGEPTESEEMAPKWFDSDKLPFDEMWPDDRYWLPEVIAGHNIFGTFTFDKHNNMLTHDVKTVEELPSE
jgi:8-oxo-dGTP pyrophosphatase MutT (NUDIX family)